MKSSAPTFDDIIFEGRNKAYGAYELRQLSDRYNTYGLLISGSALILMLALACLLSGNYGPVPVIHDPVIASPSNIPPVTPELPKTIPAPQPPAVNTKAFLEMNPVQTAPVMETDIPSQAELVEQVVSTETIETTIPTVTLVSPTMETGPSVHTTTSPVITKPMNWAPVMPSFIGGEKALREYLAAHIKMHPVDIENGVSGKLWIRFFVDIDGSIKEATVIKDTAGGHCAEAALNVISKMPKWNPGMQNNIPVRVYYNIPIVFEVK